ncbi:hypothetical protein B0H66DRAFT_644554 [Apodospora peruviana]|uniref:Uncharacterized protein n=1 Tax=Apodospora peruviana TaxID=516989 RepID=A0AAE0HSY5_9PEZI|nr:hypothetical protein B0H66DRAFT_644554 [Apodospora peruviana]
MLVPLSSALPQSQAGGTPPTVSPTVQSLTMSGPGCPIGAGGLVQQMRNNTPVFLFTEWGLALPNTADDGQDAKWCTEQIQLANGPARMQLRIATVSVGGWADLEPETKLQFEVSTMLGDIVAGSKTAVISHADLKDHEFDIDLDTAPADIWSECVDEKGIVPALTIQTKLTLVAAKRADGTFSSGVVGGEKTDLKKALSVHFDPVWRPCAASGS